MYPGVQPHHGERPAEGGGGEAVYHNYYQWVSYLLFIQSLRYWGVGMVTITANMCR